MPSIKYYFFSVEISGLQCVCPACLVTPVGPGVAASDGVMMTTENSPPLPHTAGQSGPRCDQINTAQSHRDRQAGITQGIIHRNK